VFDRGRAPPARHHPGGLAQLPPVFRENGTVTAGNASGLNDGAAALVVMSAERAAGSGPAAGPLPRQRGGGRGAALHGPGPRPGHPPGAGAGRPLRGDVDLVELNEAFAAQSLACIRELELDPDRVNVNGGAIALGHPLGCSGARILTTLVHELRRRGGGIGLATMCIGVGQGIATLVEVEGA
jgi:acetyl-CoA acetyltransferase